jgi:hypothetical protein
MPRSPEDVINTPINPKDYKSEDIENVEDDLDDEINLDDEIDPIGDSALDDELELSQDEFESELESEDENDIPELEEPGDEELDIEGLEEPEFEPEIKWTAVPQDGNEIKSEHIDGFVLRARPLSSKQGDKIKYASQLYLNKRIIEKGVIWIDKETDPREYLENISDRIISKLGFSN